jgi:hypothetical protein
MAERADKTQAYRILRTQESKIIDRYRVTDGDKFRLKDHDPADTAGHQSDKPLARALLEGGVQRRLREIQGSDGAKRRTRSMV